MSGARTGWRWPIYEPRWPRSVTPGVATYIQSGNIVLNLRRTDRAALAAEICAGIEQSHGLLVSAVLRAPTS